MSCIPSFDNVKFLLKNTTDNYYVQAELNKSEGIYYVTGHTEKEADTTKFVPMSGEVNHGNSSSTRAGSGRTRG